MYGYNNTPNVHTDKSFYEQTYMCAMKICTYIYLCYVEIEKTIFITYDLNV